jgi:hypothetical protein
MILKSYFFLAIFCLILFLLLQAVVNRLSAPVMVWNIPLTSACLHQRDSTSVSNCFLYEFSWIYSFRRPIYVFVGKRSLAIAARRRYFEQVPFHPVHHIRDLFHLQ